MVWDTRVAAAGTGNHRHQLASQQERIGPDQPRLQFLQRGRRSFAPISLRNAGDPIVGLQLEDGAQRVGLVQAVAGAQRRIGDGDLVNENFGDAHGLGPGKSASKLSRSSSAQRRGGGLSSHLEGTASPVPTPPLICGDVSALA